MGYVRGIVEQGLSVADQKAPKCAGMVQDLVERALQVPQLAELSAKALPLAERLDEQVSLRVDSGLELYDAKKQVAKELYDAKKQEAKELYDAKKQEAKELYDAKKQVAAELCDAKVLQVAAELYDAKKQEAAELAELYDTKKQEALLQAASLKARVEAELVERRERVEDAAGTLKAKAQGARQEAEAHVQEAKAKLGEQYAAKKQQVLELEAAGKAKLRVGTAAVQQTFEQVLQDGSVAELAVVQRLLARVEGTLGAAPAQRAVEAADLVLPAVRKVVLALPRCLADLQASAQDVEAPLKAKLADAQRRAQEAGGRVREEAGSVKTKAAGAAVECKGRCADAAAAALAQLQVMQSRVQTEAQALVLQHAAPVAAALKGVFGEKAVTVGYETALPLLPAGVQEWIAQVDNLD